MIFWKRKIGEKSNDLFQLAIFDNKIKRSIRNGLSVFINKDLLNK
jgi:hypothetical protein